jgi:prepilin-type processing-associated H-X9-DG protein
MAMAPVSALVSGCSGHTFPIALCQTPSRNVPRRESDVRSPANLLAIGDGFFRGPDPWVLASSDVLTRFPQPAEGYPIEELQAYGETAKVRHGDKANFLFCDGHVELLRNQQMFIDDNDAVLRRWNVDDEPHR